MCGIAGFLGRPRTDEAEICARLAQALAHRGPDGEGIEHLDAGEGRRLALVHRRLSIIDLSEMGRQPMRDPKNGNWVVFNGEIFNFKALRAALEAEGESFVSHSDTEVLLKLYARRGLDMLGLIQGMFAFALWDASKRTLVLGVDPLGIKPLYWCREQNNRFAFASEIRALIASGLVEPRLDLRGIDGFFAYGAVQGPLTAVRGVSLLPGGHYLQVSPDGSASEPRRYWAPRAGGGDSRSDEALEDLPSLLSLVAKEHLESDVPVGLFLSGGIDSSALATLCVRQGSGIKSFSVSFEEKVWSEGVDAAETAGVLGLDHTDVRLTADEMLAMMPKSLDALDQPTIDGTNVYVISRAVRDAGVKVVLSGQGGDELFGGYSTFRDVPRLSRLRRGAEVLPRGAVRLAASAVRSVRRLYREVPGRLEGLLSGESNVVDSYLLLRGLLPLENRRKLLGQGADWGGTCGLLAETHARLRREVDGLDDGNAVSHLEIDRYLGQMLLRDGDVMGMSQGLEIRVPFLDRRVVDAVLRLPSSMKLIAGRKKPLLVDSVGHPFLRTVESRRKRGFSLPMTEWLRGALKTSTAEIVCDRASSSAAGLNHDAAVGLWQSFLERRPGVTWPRVWSLVVLKTWCMKNRVSA